MLRGRTRGLAGAAMPAGEFKTPGPMLESYLERRGPDHIYYNATLSNQSQSFVLASVLDTRSDAILLNPDDYEMSVIRFDVGANSVPIARLDVFLPVPPAPAFNPLAPVPLPSTLQATLTVGGVDFTTVVMWQSPTAVANMRELGEIFNYQDLLDEINAAYLASYNAIPVKPANSAAPQFVWDSVTNLTELFVDPSYMYNTAAPPFATATIQIWANYDLFLYLNNFDVFHNGAGRTDFKDARFEVRQTNAFVQPAVGSRTNLPFSVTAAPPTLLRVRGEAATQARWDPARAFVLTSGLLPITPEFIPTNITVSNNSVSQSAQKIISDFLVPASPNIIEARDLYQYLPTAEFRMIDLVGSSPLSTIDMQMNWVDFAGRTHPLYLAPFDVFSVKILFRRRGCTD